MKVQTEHPAELSGPHERSGKASALKVGTVHAETSIAWKHTLKFGRIAESLDVMSFWKRLKGAGRAFVPGKSETGVFPLLYLRGIAATFIAIGKDELSTMVLYESAKALLEPMAPMGRATAGQLYPLIVSPNFVYRSSCCLR